MFGLHRKLDDILRNQQDILAQLRAQIRSTYIMNAKTQAAIDRLVQAVNDDRDVVSSAKKAFDGLEAQITALKAGTDDPDVVKAIDDATAIVSQAKTDLVTAIPANTAADPATTPTAGTTTGQVEGTVPPIGPGVGTTDATEPVNTSGASTPLGDSSLPKS